MRRPRLVRFAVAATMLGMVAPNVVLASELPVTAPADSATRPSAPKSEHSAPPAGKHKTPAKKTTPPSSSDPRLLPDQPWETEFFVENDLSAHAVQSPFSLAVAPR